jgi:hypothetical protein
MARAAGFDFREDLESAGIREAAVCADRREPKPSNPEPATSSTKIAPGTPTRTQPVPELFPKVVLSKVPPHQRPFPITLFLRFNEPYFFKPSSSTDRLQRTISTGSFQPDLFGES